MDSVDKTLRAGLYIGGVFFIGIDVHGEFETRIHPHQHVSENKFAVSRVRTRTKDLSRLRNEEHLPGSYDMPQRAYNSAIDLDVTDGTLEDAARRVCNIAAFANRRMNAEFELFGHRDLDLRVFARGSKDADAFNTTFRSNDNSGGAFPRARESRWQSGVFGRPADDA